jgi:hypothetical protein
MEKQEAYSEYSLYASCLIYIVTYECQPFLGNVRHGQQLRFFGAFFTGA